jgi:tetratricopeptide (TPR) repeat protein
MRETIPNKIPSDNRTNEEGRHFFKSADAFLHGPDGLFWICLLLFGLTVWAFLPALQGDFLLFDDGAIFMDNPHVNTGFSWDNLRWALFSTEYTYSYPLTRISHMLDFELFGADPWGHHLTNVLLHAANGVLLFLVLKQMTGALWRSLIVAALFALHPLRVESVAWVSERKDVLSAFFGLLALWMYARYARKPEVRSQISDLQPPTSVFRLPSSGFYWLTLLFFACGLMSKSMMVTFPFLLLLLDFWPLERWRQKGKWILLVEKAPFILLAALVSIATYSAVKAVGGQYIMHFPWSMRLETTVMGYGRYLGLMVWPSKLSAIYPYPDYWPIGQLLCAMALFLGMSALALGFLRERPYLLVGWLWYLGTLVPVIGLIPIGGESICTRFTYIPMMGALLAAVWGIDDLTKQWRGRTVPMAIAVALILGLCISRTRAEIVYWKDGVTLYKRAIAVTKNNFMAHYCLGCVLATSKPDETLAEYQKSVDIYPGYFDAQFGLAWHLKNVGRVPDAIVHLEKAIQLEPQNGWARDGLGELFLQMGRVGDAIPPLLKAVEVDPQNAPYKDDLGRALFSGDHVTEAVSNFLAAARSDPAGFGHFLDAMQFDTNHVAIINNLAWFFATYPDPRLRNGKYAVRLATRACQMTGSQTTIYVGTLGAAYAEDSRFDEALSSAQLASSLASAAGDTNLLKKEQALVELFRSRQPYHEAVQTDSP